MRDIVERLRGAVTIFRATHLPSGDTFIGTVTIGGSNIDDLIEEAADEIERLRNLVVKSQVKSVDVKQCMAVLDKVAVPEADKMLRQLRKRKFWINPFRRHEL